MDVYQVAHGNRETLMKKKKKKKKKNRVYTYLYRTWNLWRFIASRLLLSCGYGHRRCSLFYFESGIKYFYMFPFKAWRLRFAPCSLRHWTVGLHIIMSSTPSVNE